MNIRHLFCIDTRARARRFKALLGRTRPFGTIGRQRLTRKNKDTLRTIEHAEWRFGASLRGLDMYPRHDLGNDSARHWHPISA
jgi:hypothetical protein